jgi:hypothetical protein
MPIVYVHGVANRLDGDDRLPGWDEVKGYLRRYIAPVLSDDPGSVPIEFAYWGDLGVRLRWNGASRPRSKLLRQGTVETSEPRQQLAELGDLTDLPQVSNVYERQGALTSGQGSSGQAVSDFRLRDLSADELSNFLCDAIEQVADTASVDAAKLESDGIAHDPAILDRLDRAADLLSELEILRQELAMRSSESTTLAGQGPANWWSEVLERAREVAVRIDSAPVYALSRLAMELRAPINSAITTFIGDVFAYLAEKDSVPGKIRQTVLDVIIAAKAKSRDKNEPMIVVSHSMGGQIIFDLATSFLGPDCRIDFWVATASQVGLFEEMKFFLKSDPTVQGPLGRAPFPPNLGWWWNVWDSNDVLSFTVRDIFDLQVDDEEWNSGASLVAAHGAYLRRPSFYRKLAAKIRTAQEVNFNRP